MQPNANIPAQLCVNLCETTRSHVSPLDLEELIGRTCGKAGFPHCERVYAGSYFCENYFCYLDDGFHESLEAFCRRYDVRATLVVPLAGQAFVDSVERRADEVLTRFDSLYDEVVVNDVASFFNLSGRFGKRMGIGRLFSKEMRDARIGELMERHAAPDLSAEARECLSVLRQAAADFGEGAELNDAQLPRSDSSPAAPVIELDPVASVVDVSAIVAEAPDAFIAVHQPFCYATTGRNCTPASIGLPVEEKFRLGRGCSQQCLRIDQSYLTDEEVRYAKHGRTFFFENPTCAIAGVPSWRVVYQAGME